MNSEVTTSFDPMMVALSFAFAVIGSFVALSAAARLASAGSRQSRSGLLTIGVALGGIGVWSMHFVGMLALKMDVGSSYSMTETLISLILVIVSTSMAVNYAAKAPNSLVRLITAGSLLGLSVVVMHYLGMFGLKFNGYIRWDYGIVVLSAIIAVVAATAALWLTFNSNSIEKRLMAAVAMGVAVCAMHYTGMFAAEFVCTTDNRTAIPQGIGFISAFRLPSMVIIPTVLMVVMLSIDVIFQNAAAVAKKR